MSQSGGESGPGRGIAGARTTGVFRAINFELFARPVSIYYMLLSVYTCIYVCAHTEERCDGVWSRLHDVLRGLSTVSQR